MQKVQCKNELLVLGSVKTNHHLTQFWV
uniref:Uncharacterized protein n=1 Tax=Arundo donax TaxID=35708 RepID=A0A0A9GD61_ARUDO